jgi:hypothetical protein
VTDLELSATGRVAWIADGFVWKADASGLVRLDAGPGVDPTSLAVADSTVYWTRAGRSYSALVE